MVAVTGAACREEVVASLAAGGAVVVVWSDDGACCGRLVRAVLDAGGRAASFVAPPSAGERLAAFATEQFGGLDEVVGSAGAGAPRLGGEREGPGGG